MGVFSKNNQPETDVKRNAFDGSFQNNLTMKMGYLYPCFCKEVISGDTFRIKPAFGLRFMPTAFPLQTKIKAHLDFFYVRNRNLWKKWQNYFTQVGPHDGFPVLSPSEARKQLRTGSLGDYLGLPSTLVGSGSDIVNAVSFLPDYQRTSLGHWSYRLNVGNNIVSQVGTNSITSVPTIKFVSLLDPTIKSGPLNDNIGVWSFGYDELFKFEKHPTIPDYYKLPMTLYQSSSLKELFDGLVGSSSHLVCGFSIAERDWTQSTRTYTVTTLSQGETSNDDLIYGSDGYFYISAQSLGLSSEQHVMLSFYMNDFSNIPLQDFSLLPIYRYDVTPSQNYNVDLYGLAGFPTLSLGTHSTSDILESMDVLADAPFNISALPFRAYEQIYNSFYRDDRNNPLYVDGVFDPNRFLPNEDGGSDSTPYRLYKRNWEQDFLTTAMTSPQFGQAPLVGLTSTGVASFQDADGNIVTSQLQTDADGDTVIGFSSTSNPSVNSALIKLASSGISINDFRGVNALQRYLETKMRFGLRYRDQIRSHFGVNIKQEILDMPEFIGSVSQMVDVTQINQTAPVGDDPLGAFAGQLSCVGGRDGGFQKYCDEPGYIIGIISVVPVPSYSQLCPKHFLKTHEALDFYHPEFAHLGMQPIKYDEVCPLQAANQRVDLNKTFGYQRAWYDYLSNVDEVHGQFRTTLNNFLLTRVFNTLPSINPEFLTVDPDSMNQVFTVNEVNGEPVDSILGQLHFDVTMMRPISRFGVPRLE